MVDGISISSGDVALVMMGDRRPLSHYDGSGGIRVLVEYWCHGISKLVSDLHKCHGVVKCLLIVL